MLIAFAGPSLSGCPAPAGVEMRPPARRDDIRRAAEEGAWVILLIDGAFGDGPSVGHKEILGALAGGVRVVGAASMGALRAVECRDWGMEGVGRIYEDYASGRRVADADVALLHGPASLGYGPLTLPLVDVDHFADAVLAGRLGLPGLAGALRAAARTLHFHDRTWPAILDSMSLDPAGRRELARLVSSSFTSLKREDAMGAIGKVAQGAWHGATASTWRRTARAPASCDGQAPDAARASGRPATPPPFPDPAAPAPPSPRRRGEAP